MGVILGQTVLILFGINQSVFFSLVFRLLNLSFVLSEFALFYVSFSSAPLWFPLCFEKKAKQQIVIFVDLLSPFLVR